MWADKENQVYSERTDLTEATFTFLVELTLQRRREKGSFAHMMQCWERDQLLIQEAIERERAGLPITKSFAEILDDDDL